MALTFTNWQTRITQFEAALSSNFPNLNDSSKWNASCTQEQIAFHLIGYGVSFQFIWNDSEGNWFGQVNGVRYDGETPLATAKATFAAAAKAVRDAVAVQASNNSDDLTDVNP